MATRWTSKHTGQKIDDTIDYVCNSNLLDNWYFGNPVNQRGQTEHTGSQIDYFIDRWKLGSYDQTVTITNSGLHWSTTTGIWCTQILENFDELIGRTLTLSAIIDGVLYSVTGVLNESSGIGMRPVGNLFVELTHNEKGFRFVTYNDPTPTVTILAAKLELGSQQTLAHQDADGNWVLNEIPDYGEQLARCQRRQVIGGFRASPITCTGESAYVFCSTPVSLAKDVSPSLIGTWHAAKLSNNTNVGTSISISKIDENGFTLQVSGCNEPCYVYTDNGGIDCNL